MGLGLRVRRVARARGRPGVQKKMKTFDFVRKNSFVVKGGGCARAPISNPRRFLHLQHARATPRVLVWVRSRESPSKKIVVSLILAPLGASNGESGSARVGRRATSRARSPLGGVVGGVWDARVSGSGSNSGALGLFRARVRVRVRAREPKGPVCRP